MEVYTPEIDFMAGGGFRLGGNEPTMEEYLTNLIAQGVNPAWTAIMADDADEDDDDIDEVVDGGVRDVEPALEEQVYPAVVPVAVDVPLVGGVAIPLPPTVEEEPAWFGLKKAILSCFGCHDVVDS